MIDTAVVMCGGKSQKFNGVDKSLIVYKERTMIFRVFENLIKAGIKKLIIVANEKNSSQIEEEIKNFSNLDYILLTEPPRRFREVILEIENLVSEEPFLIIAGNQPVDKEFLDKIVVMHKNSNSWVVSLYPKNQCREKICVDIDANNNVKEGNSFILQHPFILTKKILDYQMSEGFRFKIEETIRNLSIKIPVKGMIAEMPPEFDNEEMLKTTKEYIDNMNQNLLVIPGNDISNKEWSENLQKTLQPHTNSIIHHYEHWQNPSAEIDFEIELDRLSSDLNCTKNKVVVAKSAGAILALKTISEGIIRPKKCIFIGFPLKWAVNRDINLSKIFENYCVKTLFIQNKEDPFCSADELKKFLQDTDIRNFKIIEKEGQTHDYNDLKFLKEKIVNFLFSS